MAEWAIEGPAWSNLTLHAFERKLPSLENTQHFAMPLVSTYVKINDV